MTNAPLFPPLDDFEPTRKTLHLYSQALGVIPRTHAEPQPKWWQISLRIRPNGLETAHMALPDGGAFWLRMDLVQHKAILQTSDGRSRTFDLAAGLTGTAFGQQIIEAVADLGLEGAYARERFKDDGPRDYDRDAAGRFLTALVNAGRIFEEHRASLEGETGPVQFWPHGFDLSFEWFGTRVETYEEHGEIKAYPSQINLGFYPGSEPYFYSNPWPFESEALLDKPLPAGARWHTEGWEGTILPYKELAGDAHADSRLKAYAQRVHEVAAPTLMVE